MTFSSEILISNVNYQDVATNRTPSRPGGRGNRPQLQAMKKLSLPTLQFAPKLVTEIDNPGTNALNQILGVIDGSFLAILGILHQGGQQGTYV